MDIVVVAVRASLVSYPEFLMHVVVHNLVVSSYGTVFLDINMIICCVEEQVDVFHMQRKCNCIFKNG